MKYVVEISDADGNAVRVSLSIPFLSQTTGPSNSSWRALDEGMLKYRSGWCGHAKAWGLGPTMIQLAVGKYGGVNLDAMFDGAGLVNSSGSGNAQQWFCVGLKPGPITWALVG